MGYVISIQLFVPLIHTLIKIWSISCHQIKHRPDFEINVWFFRCFSAVIYGYFGVYRYYKSPNNKQCRCFNSSYLSLMRTLADSNWNRWSRGNYKIKMGGHILFLSIKKLARKLKNVFLKIQIFMTEQTFNLDLHCLWCIFQVHEKLLMMVYHLKNCYSSL